MVGNLQSVPGEMAVDLFLTCIATKLMDRVLNMAICGSAKNHRLNSSPSAPSQHQTQTRTRELCLAQWYRGPVPVVPPLRWGPNEVLGAKPSDGVPLHEPFKRALLDLLLFVGLTQLGLLRL